MTLNLPSLIAHRGACAYAPENTFAAMRIAHEKGAKWVEFDVRMTRDQELIIFHDKTLERITGQSGEISEVDYKDIKNLDAGVWFDEKFSGEKIPSFVELMLQLADLKLGMNVELKLEQGQEQAIAQLVIKQINQYWPATLPSPLISSYNYEVLKQIRNIDPNVYLGWLPDIKEIMTTSMAKAKALNTQFIHLDKMIVTKDIITELLAYDFLILTYVENDKQGAKERLEMGVTSIFSDYPDLLSTY